MNIHIKCNNDEYAIAIRHLDETEARDLALRIARIVARRDRPKKTVSYDVYFQGLSGGGLGSKIEVIKEIRSCLNLPLKEAKDMSESSREHLLARGLDFSTAAAIRERFTRAGAVADVRAA